jgi:hypothetical protein
VADFSPAFAGTKEFARVIRFNYALISGTDDTTVATSSQQAVTSPNGKPSVIPVSTASPVISNLPVRDDSTIDPSCDAYGVCYEVTLKCTDTKILVNVKTSKPFHGRIYALGRSETCNAHIRNSQQFNLDMSLGGQDCNTQSVVSIHTSLSSPYRLRRVTALHRL